MRIAFFTEGYDPFTNGVIVLLNAYRDALRNAGCDVTVFAPEHEDQPPVEDGVVRLPSLTFHRQFYPVLRPLAGITKRFRGGEFDIIHSHHPFTCGLLAERLSKRHGVPLVYTFHTLLTQQAAQLQGPAWLAELGMLRLIQRHCEHAHLVTTSTHVMADWLRAHRVETPIRVVRPSAPSLRASPDARPRLRSQWQVRPSTVVALCASRLSPEKDVDQLLHAMACIPARLGVRLLIAGDGPDRPALEALAHALGLEDRVRFLGEVPHHEIADVYAAADLFTFPSRNDTLGLVVLEAMAMGLPVICADVNGPAEVVRDGVDGLQVSADARVLAHAIMRLALDPETRTRLGRAAREGCSAFCSKDLAGDLLQCYAAAAETQRNRQLDASL